MKSTFSTEINATPEDVFYWLDDPERVMQWIDSLVENENITVTPDTVGSTFRQVYDENGRRFEMNGRVTRYQPPYGMTADIDGKAFDLTVTYELVALTDSKTRLTQVSEIRFKGVMKLMSWFMGFAIRRSQARAAQTQFNKLKVLCEST